LERRVVFGRGGTMLEGYKLRRCFLGGGVKWVKAGKIKIKYMNTNVNVNMSFMFVIVIFCLFL
jgi:hypothetical protein